ncbi:helicase protein MOM1-like, partial [Telopea speciosissima]|uniref:helicase protein MOM1-like n=1 Tax=Telopea speciosissima TaxID=54955 RepID=UPI001CC5DCC2
EQYMKVILFIMSLQSDVWRPSLIVSSALSVWETQFLRLAPSINVVVYSGNSDVRKSIRALEFYEESGCVMFQVLLSTPDAIVEDLEVLECLGWEALVVDDCQQSRVSKYCEQMKCLSTDFRLLVASGQIKDSLADYLNLLAFLDSGVEGASPDGLKVDSSDNIGKLKERLTQFVPFECKSESSKFVEYWVPVELSSVQLEHYCFTLFSNELSLRSCSKNDSVGTLRDILISVRKCCDHPYLLEPSLQSLLTKGLPEVEYLDVGIKASGKLQLLDKFLQEIKRRGLRALILFQSFGGSRLGDILDDFLRQRFGLDSYEHVDGLVSSKKKQAAVNMFNNKERGRFVFLLENRACHQSIKLSSVDIIILFDSDWNPLNDLRGLQRIHIDSQLEQLKVFRLYTSRTVEEKILSLVKQDISLDSNIHNVSHNTCQMLLIWGASYLFGKLDGFHGGNTSPSYLNILSNEPFMNAVVEELLIHLPQNAENSGKNNCSFISKVKQSGATYSRDIPLLGESEMQLRDEEPPHVFWTKLLQGRYPRWRYLSGSSPRIRKRVQYFEGSPRKSGVVGDEAIKKCKKVADNTINPLSLKRWIEDKRKLLSEGKEGTSGAQAGNGSQSLPISAVMSDKNHVCSMPNEISSVSGTNLVESTKRRKLRDAQKSLHLLLKPEISKLCEILNLPGCIKVMAGRFLEYIMNNHHVNREPVAILQAFQISVCWTAAASFKHKIDHKESLAHVKQLLNFECKEEEVEFIFSKLWMLKKMFHSVEDSSPKMKNVSEILLCASSSQSMTSAQEEFGGEIRDSSQSCNFPQYVPAKQEQATDFDKTSWSEKNDFLNISQFKKICAKRIKKLLQKQQEEVQKFNEIRQKEKAKLEEELTLKLVLIHAVDEHISIRLDKMKKAEQDHAKKIEENNRRWEVLRKNLEALQLVARNGEQQMNAHWLEQAKSGKSVGPFANLPLPVSGFRLEEMMACEGGATQISGPPSKKSDPNITFPTKPGEGLPSRVTKTIPNKTTEGSGMDATLIMQPNREDGVMDATVVVQFIGDSNRMGAMLDRQPNREDDGVDATVAMQSNEDRNRLDTTLDMQPSRVDVRGGANSLDMQSNEDKSGLDGTIAMHSVRVDKGVDTTVAMQPHKDNEMDTTYSMESCREDNAMDVSASKREILAGDEQHNRADCSNSSLEPTQIDSHSMAQPHVTTAQNSSSALDVLPHVEHCEPPTEAAVLDEAAPSCEMQNTPEHVQVPSHQPADVLPSDESNHDTSVMEPVQQLPLLLSVDPPSTACDQQDDSVMGTCHVTTNEDHTSYQQAQIQEPLMENPAESSNHSDSTPPVEDHSEPSHSLPQPIAPWPLHLPVERPSVGSGALPSDTSMTTIPESSNCPQIIHLVGSGTYLSVTGGVGTVPESSNHPPQPTAVATQTCQPGNCDPLQREIERLQKEKEQTIKFHGDLKLQLESECEKELEDVHRKYAALLQEAESTLVQRTKALDANYNNVFMNKMLAHAFRSKFSGQRASGAQGQQQGMPTSFMQQLFQLSSHQHARRPTPLCSPPAAPPLQVVHHSSALFSSNPARQHISPVVPSAGNFQVASEQRAPAPNVRPFRPSTSMSAPNIQPLPHTIPSQQELGNAASTSSMVPQLASRVPTHSSGPFSRSKRLESAGELADFSSPSFPVLDLLLDVSNQVGVNPPSLLQPLPDLGPTLDALDPSELTTYGSLRGTAARTGPAADVCISGNN